jgi:heme a synthase
VRLEISPASYRRITLLALIALAAIVVTGAAVRLTGSGLGCSDWPTCEEGRLAPEQITDAPAMIEFTNRTITGVVSVAVIAAVLGSMWRSPRRRDLTILSWGLVAGVVAQILLGALVVELELSPRIVMAHFLLSMVLVANAVVLHHRAATPDDAPDQVLAPTIGAMSRVVVAAAAVVVFTGTIVTASGPHAGDEQANRLDFALPEVARIHGLAVIVLIVLVLVVRRLAVAQGSSVTVDHARTLLIVIAAQAAVGYTQYFTGVPALLVGVHICGALAVWITALQLSLVTRVPAPRPVAVVAS